MPAFDIRQAPLLDLVGEGVRSLTLSTRLKLTFFLTFSRIACAALERPPCRCPNGPILADPIELATSVSVFVSITTGQLLELLDWANEADVVW